MPHELKKYFFIRNKMDSAQNKKTVRGIPEPTIRRMPLYLSYLKTIDTTQRENISAPAIAKDLGFDSTQITKDLGYTEAIGKTRVGFNIEELIKAIEIFLGYNKKNKAFLIGAGSLGTALLKYGGFAESGFNIVAAFDKNPSVIGKQINGIEIFNIKKFQNLVSRLHITIGIITVSDESAQSIADLMVKSGITAIWNFAPTPIKVREGIIVENTSIYSNLAVLIKKIQ